MKPRTGEQYLKELHELRSRMWEEARAEGLTSRQFVERINRDGMRIARELGLRIVPRNGARRQ